MTKKEAIEFFAEFYGGEHHIPGEIFEDDSGWRISHCGSLATFDSNALTRLVIMAHDKCIRTCISGCNHNHIKISIWNRNSEGTCIMDSHPTIEQALKKWRKIHFPRKIKKPVPVTSPRLALESKSSKI